MDGRPEESSDLDTRVAALEAELAALRRSTIRVPRGLRRPAVVLIALAVALAVPGMALASHIFTDVPNTNTFHAQIATLAGAGITRGCNVGNTKYCPADYVRRDAMAGFLTRGLGRMAADRFDYPTTTPNLAVATVSIRAEGTAYLHSIATFEVQVSGSLGYPCDGFAFISVDGLSYNESLSSEMKFRQQVAPNGFAIFQLAGQSIRVVGPGTHTVVLRWVGIGDGGCIPQIGRGYLSSTVVPFGGDGGPATTPN